MAESPKKRTVSIPSTLASTPGRTLIVPLSTHERHQRIAQGAYLRSRNRDFAPEGEIADWLAAERAVDSQFRPAST